MDWDPWFDRGRPWFTPLHEALAPFRSFREWPDIAAWNAAFPPLRSLGGARIVFVQQPPKRRGGPVDVDSLYDERIYVRGEVPSRARNWHDFFNMLVWHTLPRTKVAINARQRRALRARVSPGMRRLPGARTREQDLLAMLDEGGAIERADGTLLVLGHAIYEHLACHPMPVHACVWRARGASLAEVDDELARFLLGDGSLEEHVSRTIEP
jgi:hypothetical protein